MSNSKIAEFAIQNGAKQMSKLMRAARMMSLAALVFTAFAVALPTLAADSATYTYDALGRLTQVTYANGTTVQYSYDAAGNRTAKVVTCSGSGC